MTEMRDALIVGSGPSGVAAAWPLVRAGLKVTMLDAARPHAPPAPVMSLDAFRRSADVSDHVLGKDLGHVRPLGNRSPKFVTPMGRSVLAERGAFPPIRARNFIAPRSFAAGGLSNIWGALTSAFDSDDLKEFPIAADDLRSSYAATALRIGISGADDDMGEFHGLNLPLQKPTWVMPAAARLLERYARGTKSSSFRLGLARNAVITENLGDRLACNASGLCLYGCGRGSIYNSAAEIADLRLYPNFSYLPGHTVRRLVDVDGVQRSVETECKGEVAVFAARSIVLAAGTLNTTFLVLDRQGATGSPLRLMTNPTAAVAFFVPAPRAAREPRHFALGQLSYRLSLPEPEGGYATGTLYGVDTLPLTTLADRMPALLSRPTAMRLTAALAPYLLVANCFLPGRYSRNRLTLEPTVEGHELRIEGSQPDATVEMLGQCVADLSRAMRRLGAYRLPGSMSIVPPGADAHLAATLPMSREDRPFTSSPWGEIRPWSGIFAVDGAVLSDLPAKHCTFTLMANAERISRAITAQLQGSAHARTAVA